MEIKEHYSLKEHHTFKIPVQARYFAEARTADEILELSRHPVFRSQEKLVLGSGSNVFFTKNFEGLVIKIAIPGIEITKRQDGYAIIRAGAGVNWQELVDWSLQQNFAGLENLSMIPGTVGASPIQNIGAYGIELKDVCEGLEAMDLESGEIREFTSEECRFGYRNSIFKNELRGRYAILAVSLKVSDLSAPGVTYRPIASYGDLKTKLEAMDPKTLSPRLVSETVSEIRRTKLPNSTLLGNAGSFFKNPVLAEERAKQLIKEHPQVPWFKDSQGIKISAGWLIEQCGWKGKRVGNTGCYEKQALVIVNYGAATAKEILAFAYNVQSSVRETFGIELAPEVNII
ncbi:MAG TPA: UDP-N-acetylmuramate dehydrogenase [Candidatus Omnitrophota bacterium]|nr:UDP-N-acetylmuramate dehydrogenase [Candidatus Omnitrophota bacterium]